MQYSEKVRIIDTVIAMMCDGKTTKEIADALNIKEAVVKAIESRLEITRF